MRERGRGRGSSEGRPRDAKKPRREGEAYASSKRVEREERQATFRRRSRTRLLVLLVAVVAVVIGLLFVSQTSVFAVRTVEVKGTKHLTPARVRALAKVSSSTSLLRVGAGGIAERVAVDPWVSHVDVRRQFPHTLVITVTERSPEALLDLGDTFWLLDAQGWFLQKASLDETSTLPVIRDVVDAKPKVGVRTASASLRNALKLIAGLSTQLRATVHAVSAPTIDETALITTDGVEMRFGSATDVAKKDSLARRILKDQAGKVVFIDVRTVDRPVWRGLEK